MKTKVKCLVACWCLSSSIAAVAAANGVAEPVSSEGIYYLPTVTVEGTRYILGEYVRAAGSMGLLGERGIMNTPLAVTTLSEKAIEDFVSPTDGLAGTLALVPSVQYVGNPAVDQITIRGFKDDGRGYTVNGIPGMTAMNRQTTNYVASVDVIEGPSTGITGTSGRAKVGGTVNVNSKVAGEEDLTQVGVAYYSKKAIEESVDIGRRFGDDQRYGIRINASNVSGERGVDHWNLKQRNIYANLDQQTEDSKTNVLLGYVYTDSIGRPIYTKLGSKVTKVPQAPSGKVNLNPSWREDKYDQYIFTLNHEQKISHNATAFVNAGYYKQDWYYCLENSSGTTLVDDKGTYETSFEVWPIIEKKYYLQLGVRGEFMTGAWKNEYALAWDTNHINSGSNGKGFGPKFVGNIYHPDSATWVKPNGQADLKAPYTSRSRLTGVSLTDTITSPDEKLTVVLGIHRHSAKQNSYYKDGKFKSDNGGTASANSPTIGVNYVLSPNLAVFGMHTEQFALGSFVSGEKYENNGTLLPPAKSKQNEIGLKYTHDGFYHKLSLFDIEQPTVVDISLGYKNKNGKDMYRKAYDGKTRHRGLEYTVAGSVNDKLNIIGGAMYLQAKRDKTTGGRYDGKRSNGVPIWTANFGLEYRATEDLSVLARLNYTGSSYIQNEKFKIPGYFRWDAGVRYRTRIGDEELTVRAMCYNVGNKKYWQPDGDSLYIGSGRTFAISADMRF